MILPSSLFASVIITNSQVYVYGDASAGTSFDSVGPSTVSATGNQTWTRAVSAARSGYFGNAAVNLASVIGLSQFSLATINSGVTLSRSGVAQANIVMRLSMNFTVTQAMNADFSAGGNLSGADGWTAIRLTLLEDSANVVSLVKASNGNSFISDSHVLLTGKSYYFAVSYETQNSGGAFDSHSASITNASGSMSVSAIPEPSTYALLALGALTIFSAMRRRRANS